MTQTLALVNAFDDFIKGCKTDGTWGAVKASCILAGWNNLDGALTPLVGAAPTNNNFVAADYNRKTGLVGNGSTKYLNSNRSQTADPQNNHHLATHVTTTGTGTLLGARAEASSGFGDSIIFLSLASNWPFRSRISAFDTPSQGTRSVANATGFIALSRSSSTSIISRLSDANETITTTSTTPLTGNIGVFARIRTDTLTVDSYGNPRLAFYSIGESLNLTLLDTRVTTLVNAIAAAVADPNFSSVSLLLHMDGSNGSTTFTDSSSNALSVTANGNTQISTAQSKFGGASVLFDGTGDYLETPHNAGFNFGAGDFTIEFWLRTGQTTTGTLIGHRTSGGATNTNWLLQANFPTSNKIGLYLSDGSVYQVSGLSTTTSVNDNQWHHIAVTRSGSSVRMFVDGVLENTATWAGSISSTSRVLQVGYDNSGSNYLNGYIDDLRITKGVARYTVNFTPPIAPFPD